jgi:hypothetical protein
MNWLASEINLVQQEDWYSVDTHTVIQHGGG